MDSGASEGQIFKLVICARPVNASGGTSSVLKLYPIGLQNQEKIVITLEILNSRFRPGPKALNVTVGILSGHPMLETFAVGAIYLLRRGYL